MKKGYSVFTFLLFALSAALLVSCSSAKSTSQKHDSREVSRANTVKREGDLDNANVSLADMLRRVPGVVVNGDNTIMIRGPKSLLYSDEPLFVVDGTPVGVGYNSITSLNPNDVDSITVLKGPSASIYGSRGANGVILIKTKE